MPTILIDRKTGRRCDSNCHDAKHEKCNCICGGKYHGVGNAKGQLEHDIQTGAEIPAEPFDKKMLQMKLPV